MLVMCVRLSLGLLWLKRLADSGYSANQLNPQHWQHHPANKHWAWAYSDVRCNCIVEDLRPDHTGYWRIYFTAGEFSLGMPADLLKALIAHEIAHIKRWDYAANLAQNLVLALLFYHPVVWWIARVLKKERDNCRCLSR